MATFGLQWTKRKWCDKWGICVLTSKFVQNSNQFGGGNIFDVDVCCSCFVCYSFSTSYCCYCFYFSIIIQQSTSGRKKTFFTTDSVTCIHISTDSVYICWVDGFCSHMLHAIMTANIVTVCSDDLYYRVLTLI